MTKYILLAISLSVVVLQGTAPQGAGWVALTLSVLVVVAVVVLGLILRSQAFAVKLGTWSESVCAGCSTSSDERRSLTWPARYPGSGYSWWGCSPGAGSGSPSRCWCRS